jgi:hypothetical protein
LPLLNFHPEDQRCYGDNWTVQMFCAL